MKKLFLVFFLLLGSCVLEFGLKKKKEKEKATTDIKGVQE